MAGFTKEMREKAAKTRAANKAAREQQVEVVSVKGMDPGKTKDEQIAQLQAQLAASEAKRSDAEKIALRAAEAQGALMQNAVEEVPTGKKIKIRVLDEMEVVGYKDSGQEIYKPKFKSVEVETFYYKIDLPPVGGEGIRINGSLLYHGQVVEVDVNLLRALKDIVYRNWRHDRDIHGTDENFYRKMDPNWQARNARVMGR